MVETAQYIEFNQKIGDLKALENLVGLEIVIQYEVTAGSPRKAYLRTDTMLIGHVNADDGGCCGCCSSFRDDTTVVRYRRVYDPTLTPPVTMTEV